ncbi:hypothetical protein GCM10018793_60340 [Streptomyces sulfonofaciens]|uniref:Beta-ketoacyl-[acyl-carrier-protein] synthase III N-terminal domain-containing protein n=1 Tax=Streptomyces sulfonofaciens TaxID=68272 RepID=A0A919GLQ3_9ACTN|nr:acyl carrier protein [Streptomyces sulfonofaciens]GHH86843.1 hypothetical protein GCM10018793_60340 [Streptomyces sulfonofaciens]
MTAAPPAPGAYVTGCAAALGTRRAKVAELPAYAHEPPRAGARFGEYREADGTLLDLLRPALAEALDAAGTDPATVDTVLLATESLPRGDASATAVAGLLDDLGMSRAYPLTLGLADCSTATAALETAAALVRSGSARAVAVLSGDLVETVLPGGRVIMGGSAVAGDGAAAALVCGERRGWEVAGGARRVSHDLLSYGLPGQDPPVRGSAVHRMRAQLAVYRELFADLWSATGLSPREVAAVLPSNMAADTLEILLGEAGFAPEQIYQDNVARIGHCLGSDPLINLVDRTESGATRSAYPVVVLLGSSAAHLAAVLLRAVED